MTTAYFNYHFTAMWKAIAQGLGDLGYDYDSKTESKRQFLARAVSVLTSSSVSSRRYSFKEMLAMLLSYLTGSNVSAYNFSQTLLMAAVCRALKEKGAAPSGYHWEFVTIYGDRVDIHGSYWVTPVKDGYTQ